MRIPKPKQTAHQRLIAFTKKINGTYYVVEAAFENKHKKMWVQSTYLTKNKEDVTQTASADNGQDTDAQSASASPSSNNTVPRNTGIVNNNISQNGGDNTENSNLQSNAKDNEAKTETMSFEEDGAEDTTEELSYEEKIMLESSGIDTSVTQKQKRINKIAERLGVKIAWDIDGDPSEVGNGYYENGVIHMNKRAKALATVFAHEYIHHIEQSKLWPSFKKFIEGTKAYKDWITVRGGNSDVEQAEKNYKLRLETAYSKAGKEVADSDVIANFMAERFFGGSFEGDAKSEENAALLLSEISKSDKWYHNIIRWARQMISKFKGDKLGEEFYKMEGLLLKARKDVQKNPTTNTGGRKYSLSANFSQSDIKENIIKVANMKSVANLEGNEFQKSDIDLVTQVERFYDSIGKVAKSKYGEVELNRNGIKSSLGHGIGRKKAVAFKAVPDVLRNGEVIDYQINWKGRGYGSAVFAAPIKISNEDYFVAAVVIVEKNKNSYYLHEVALQKKENDAPFKTGTVKNGTPSDASFSIYSLLQKLQNVNEKSGNRKNSVTPASEAETIARLAKEGRSAEYVKQRVDASMDAERVAKRWLKANKSSYDSEKLAAKITRKAGVQALAFFCYM